MNTRVFSRVVTTIAAALALAACGGGSGSSSAPSSGNTNSGTTSTAGLWKGSFTSTTTGQTSVLVVMTDSGGHSTWMTTDGRVYAGTMPTDGSHFQSHLNGYMDPSSHFPDGTNMGPGTMTVDSHSTSMMDGHYSGSGDQGTFDMRQSSMWARGAGLDTVAGTYMRTTSTGYAMTMTLGSDGQLQGSDTAGCTLSGTVSVPDPSHNLYHMDVSVTSCGAFDGNYQGMGSLVDADAMHDWMSHMPGFEHGGMMGGGMVGGGMMGHNTVPDGQHNLFMFSIVNDHHAMMDALAR